MSSLTIEREREFKSERKQKQDKKHRKESDSERAASRAYHRVSGLRGLLLEEQRLRAVLLHAEPAQIVVGETRHALGLAHVGTALKVLDRLAVGRVLGAAAHCFLGLDLVGPEWTGGFSKCDTSHDA